jgi:glycosyltransferase involved in cell wall biosynthesis
MSYVPWSPEMQFNLMQMCDFMFLPSLDTDEKKSKGHDRLVEAINAGRIAIAHPLPQYQELAEYCYCGADYAASIDQALSHPADVLQKLGKGQTYIDTRFSPEVIAGKWREHIDQLVPVRGTGL